MAKGAARLADRIVAEVSARGWPVGQVLGSEKELLERYGVSRAVFREAVRIVEHQGVAHTRRGPGGGLVVTEPPVLAVIDALVFYLYRIGATLAEVFEARRTIEGFAAEVACARLRGTGAGQVAAAAAMAELVADEERRCGGDPRVFHGVVAGATANPAIVLFADVLNRVALLYAPGWKRWARSSLGDAWRAHARIAEAVLAAEPAAARRRMLRHLEAEERLFSARRTTLQSLPPSGFDATGATAKLAIGVARRLSRRIVDDVLVPGALIGTETELLAAEGVSRAVFREAVRLLEYHSVAGMRRGPGGGLVVLEPDPKAVAEVVAIFLTRQGLTRRQLAELRAGLAGDAEPGRVLALVAMVLARIDALPPGVGPPGVGPPGVGRPGVGRPDVGPVIEASA